MLACRDIEGLMMDWLYNELDHSHSTQFQEHLGSCAACGAELRALERTRAAFRDLQSEEPPASVSAKRWPDASADATLFIDATSSASVAPPTSR